MFYGKLIRRFKQNVSGSDIGQRMVSGISWSLAGTICAKLLLMIANIVVARIMGKEMYGEFGMAKSTLNMLMIFGSAGLGITATKYIAEYRNNHPQMASKIYLVTNVFALVLAFLVAVLVFIFADLISIDILHAQSLIEPMKVVGCILFFIVINIAQEGVLSGFEDFKHKSINGVIGNIIQSILIIVGAYLGGVVGAVCGYGSGIIVTLILNKYSINRNFKKIGVIHDIKALKLSDFKVLYSYSLPAAISSILLPTSYWVIRAILVRHTDFNELATYDVADQWRILVLFIPATICHIAMPILSSIPSDNVKKFKRVLNLNLSLNMGIAVFASIIMILLSAVIMGFYGEEFTDTKPFIIMAVSCIFTSASTILGVSISSKAKMWTWCLTNIIWSSVAIGSSYIFIQMGMGALGAALGILVSFFTQAIIQYLYMRHLLFVDGKAYNNMDS